MAKKPDDRYQSAGEFAKAIQAVTTGVHRKPSFRASPDKVSRYLSRTKRALQRPSLQSRNGTLTPVPGNYRQRFKPRLPL